MERANTPPRKFEEYAYIIDFKDRAKSLTVRGREGIIITAIGEERLTLLEILGIPDSNFEVGEKIFIGKDGRTKIESVLGKMKYDQISSSSQSELETIVQKIITQNEPRFVNYINTTQPLTPRIHALELIPGIGKTYMKIIIEEREKNKFESFNDIQERVGLKDLVSHISQRIMEEITGKTRMNLFVKR